MNTKQKCDDFQDHIYVLTPEGSKKFFELMEQPNPRAEETRRRGKELITPEQCAKLGKEPVTFIFHLKHKCVSCNSRTCYCFDPSRNF